MIIPLVFLYFCLRPESMGSAEGDSSPRRRQIFEFFWMIVVALILANPARRSKPTLAVRGQGLPLGGTAGLVQGSNGVSWMEGYPVTTISQSTNQRRGGPPHSQNEAVLRSTTRYSRKDEKNKSDRGHATLVLRTLSLYLYTIVGTCTLVHCLFSRARRGRDKIN